MSKQPTYKKILEHPDREEIINKLILGITPVDIHDWLKAKYTNASEAKFVLSEKIVKSFLDNNLDFYNEMQQHLGSVKASVATNSNENLEMVVKSNPAYHDALLKVANKELDIDTIMAKMAINVETRMAQIYDEIQADPRNINTKIERVWIEYIDSLGNLLDKYHKWKEARQPDQIVQHNVTLQVVDQHISVFHDVIKEILSQIDLETSQYFLEVFNEKMSKLKQPVPELGPSQDVKLAEAKLLNETINKKINDE